MTDDRNKTELTRRVTSAVVAYLDERGCKPLETEVPICDGWIADVAAVLSPTITELVKLKLMKPRPRWNHPGYEEWWLSAKAAQQLMTVLVEVKTSRADFSGDKKWTLPIPVNLAYLAVPNSLAVPNDEMPAGWGLLVYSEATGLTRCSRSPVINGVTAEQQRDVILSVAVRRDHDTRYERIRNLRREIRARENEEVTRVRYSRAIRAMLSIVKGEHGTLEEALDRQGIKHLPYWEMDELKKLWAIKPPIGAGHLG